MVWGRLPLTSILPPPSKIEDLDTRKWANKLNTFLDEYMRRTALKVNEITTDISAGAVLKTLFNANTILYATSDDTPVALTVGASTIVGRKASGNISAMSVAETRTVLGLDTDDAVTFGSVAATSFVIGEDTLDTNEWAFLDGQDQAVKTTDGPTFDHVHISSGETYDTIIAGNSNEYTADRTLTINLENDNRSLTMEAGLLVEAESQINQDLTSDSTAVTFAALTFNFSTQDYLITNRLNNALAIQSNTADANPELDIFTKDGDGADDEFIYMSLWGKGLPSDTTNSERLVFIYETDSSEPSVPHAKIATAATGTGTMADLAIYTGLNTTQLVLATDGNVGMAGDLTVNDLIIGDARYIGSASDTDAIAIAADGKTTFTQDLTVNEDIIIGDAKYIGSASDPDAIQIEADGDIVLTQDLAISGSLTVTGWLSYDDTSHNTFVGTIAGRDITTGTDNTFFGYHAGYSITEGDRNTLVGGGAGDHITTGYDNTCIGSQTGGLITSGYDNLVLGAGCGHELTTGYRNVIIGRIAGYQNKEGAYNVIIGYRAGYGVDETTNHNNVFIGREAGEGITTGGGNIFIGKDAGDACTSGSNNIVIGYQSDVSAAGVSNYLNIGGAITGDLSAGNITIAGTLATGGNVDITGTIRTTADQDWNLGAASAQADFAGDTKIRVTIGGTDYDLVAKAA